MQRLDHTRLLLCGISLCLSGWFCSMTASIGTAHADQAPETESTYTTSLFDGSTLNGWTIENDCEVEVRDGMILLKSGDGWLRSDHTYTDFVLELEWKALQAEGYDSGIYLRAGTEGKPFPKQGYQVNLLEGQEGNIGPLQQARSQGLIRPAGEWNQFEIRVIGETVALVINGEPAYTAEGATIPAGHIGLQVEAPKGGEFLFRNLKVTELGYRSLFNGNDLAGWEGAGQPAESCWKVEDGAIICTGQKGPWLRSQEEFGDFNLRFDYQVAPGGNSGIYVRVPQDGNHHRHKEEEPPAGFEVQILDDAAPQYAKLKNYQYSGSVYAILGPTHKVCKPAGEWNTMEINCAGHHVTTLHNGVKIVDADPEKIPQIKLRQLKGFLGLQNHSTVVRYRNLRIGAARDPQTFPDPVVPENVAEPIEAPVP